MTTTFAHAVAAILWAALAYYASELIKPYFPEGRNLSLFSEFNAFMGLIVGWRVAGSRAGSGWNASISYGFTTTFFLVLWALFFQCVGEMIRLAFRKRYDGAVEAVVSVFELMLEYGILMFKQDVILTLVIGGIIAGIVTEFFARRTS